MNAKKKPVVAKKPKKAITAECPHGGSHEWIDAEGGAACKKCQEPKSIKVVKTLKTAQQENKLSAVDAAAKLLAESPEALNCKQLIQGIATKGYWTSPGGKTPHSTLYAAILREIATKGTTSRFTKAGPGKFALKTPA